MNFDDSTLGLFQLSWRYLTTLPTRNLMDRIEHYIPEQWWSSNWNWKVNISIDTCGCRFRFNCKAWANHNPVKSFRRRKLRFWILLPTCCLSNRGLSAIAIHYWKVQCLLRRHTQPISFVHKAHWKTVCVNVKRIPNMAKLRTWIFSLSVETGQASSCKYKSMEESSTWLKDQFLVSVSLHPNIVVKLSGYRSKRCLCRVESYVVAGMCWSP